ncbi:thiol:disulfide interchange protein DsbA [Microbulbifer aestuariivivens]|uniref:Thiol:disulfide interchange protein n=1 Tax=Microbulbifer aestuariivivens TaxID=1908308 RepID=A0ABP9WMZ8_9GAMM
MRAVTAPIILLLALLFSITACAEDNGQFKAGQHYQVLPQPVPQRDQSTIEVTELFWYGCGHCYDFEPLLKSWKGGIAEGVTVKKIPAIWQPVMEIHARMFYVADAMGVLDTMHEPIFKAIAQQRKMFAQRAGRDWNADNDAIAALFEEHGADGEKAVKLMNSFAVNSKVKQGMANQRAYQLSGTPEVVVAGKYRISSSLPGFKGKSNAQEMMLQVADYLIEKERAERG